ncbi:MAG: sugar phosphate isomerase/epimerase [Planctomycetota bacterium]|nr:sugar phosphate isomerase/epimerase [Planctomycetota bacterium]
MAEKRRIVLPHEVAPAETAAAALAAKPALPRIWELALAARAEGCSPAEAARAGFRQIEISASRGELADPLRLIGLGASRLKADLRHLDLGIAAICWRGPAAARSALSRREALSALRAVLEAGHTLGSALLTIRGETTSPEEKAEGWRYLLDVIYDLETDLRRAGMAAALEAGGEAADALTDPQVIRDFLAAAPADTRLAWDQEYFSAQRTALGELVTRAAHVRLPAAQDERDRLILADAQGAGDMVAAVSATGGGAIAVLPHCAGRPSEDDLRALHQEVGRLLLAEGREKER